jgi:flagellar basal-body rod protein FlgB
LIQDLANAGALPVLEKSLRFASARQRVLVNNIANSDTPDYRPLDLSVEGFQSELRRAIAARERDGGAMGMGRGAGPDRALEFQRTREIDFLENGTIKARPRTPSGNILYHDRNNRDIERMMQDLAENNLAYRTTVELMRRENDTLRIAITQRP